jgi:UDP-3-O-[3-hydroxymyristoyl] glucosamine N-acyltransferase
MRIYCKYELGAVIESEAVIREGVWIGEEAVIKTEAVIGEGVWIGGGAGIETGAVIGKGTWIGEKAWIGEEAVIGSGAMIGSGAIIGSGTEIRDRTMIEAGSMIEGGAVIEAGAKIDCIISKYNCNKYFNMKDQKHYIRIGCEIRPEEDWKNESFIQKIVFERYNEGKWWKEEGKKILNFLLEGK